MSEIGDRTGPAIGDHFGPPTEEHRLIPEITYDEQFYPARPRRLRPSARRVAARQHPLRPLAAPPTRSNDAYVEWLVEQSMLHDAKALAIQLSGQGSMWQNPFAHPDPRAARRARGGVVHGVPAVVHHAAAASRSCRGWPTAELWQAFREIGIDAVHTGPVKLAGGLNGWRPTPSVDGHFDRISMQVDPDVRHRGRVPRACARPPREYDGTVIDDIVPGHTGKGADFRLAEMGYARLPGHLPHGLDPPRRTGTCCPRSRTAATPSTSTSTPRPSSSAAGYIIGRLQRVIFYEPGVKETNWSATRVGHRRRRRRAALGLPALLQGGPAVDQLARPVVRRHAAGDRRRAARARRPRLRRAAPGRQRLPRRREERRGRARPGRRAIRSPRRPTT